MPMSIPFREKAHLDIGASRVVLRKASADCQEVVSYEAVKRPVQKLHTSSL
jgi:hypothetical protein